MNCPTNIQVVIDEVLEIFPWNPLARNDPREVANAAQQISQVVERIQTMPGYSAFVDALVHESVQAWVYDARRKIGFRSKFGTAART